MPAVALTDHGGLYGAVEFYELAREAGIKPIIGCEVYVVPTSRFEKSKDENVYYHLILLAKNHHGYENLVELVSRSHLEGFYYKPRVDKELLSQYSEGLIALSGCLTGEIPQLLHKGRYKEALYSALDYQKIYGQENFYLELQNHGLKEEIRLNGLIKELAVETSIPLVATNDVHYLNREGALLQELLVSIRTLKPVHQPNNAKLPNQEFYLKSPEEMKKLFWNNPEALTNTLKISQQCNLQLDFGTLRLPLFSVPDDLNQDEYLSQLCHKGMLKRYPSLTPEIQMRLEKELNIIRKMNMASYFLIVADLVAFARENGIPIGPGRGSAGGSLVAYVLGITNIDPIKYNLFFERFLNPERLDLPDIDLDFCQRRREEVLSYLYRKYGTDNLAQIGIFSTLGARGAVRDVGKALKVPERLVDLVARNLPRFSGYGGIEHALATLPEFKEFPLQDEPFRSLIEKASCVEGIVRHTSIHAAGVVIGQGKLNRLVPLQSAPGGEIVTQYGPESLEALGLVKIDLLGLRNLTIIDDTLKLIEKTRMVHLSPETIPLDDVTTYRLLQKGDTLGCFQLESTGMRRLLKKLTPRNLADVIAILALYRPGPWESGMVDSFLKRRHGEEVVTYPHPSLEPVLKDTYGIVLFQEQVMQIAHTAAGYNMGKADLLRRIIAKKGIDLGEHEQRFIKGCLQNGIGREAALQIFNALTKFTGYSFNKAHSVAYAHISYQCAYLKANYPVEYYASLLSSMTGYYSLSVYVEEARRKGIKLLPPDVNNSTAYFSVDNSCIRVGFALIKGVGGQSIQVILKERKRGGTFPTFDDFCNRIDLKVVNRAVITNLIKVGAFDSLGLNRAQLLGNLDNILKAVRKKQKVRASGQLSFWDLGLEERECGFEYYLNFPDYTFEEKARLERELLTISIWEHPLAEYKNLLSKLRITGFDRLSTLPEGSSVTVAGIVVNFRRQPTKNKDYMLFMLLEDQFAQVEVILFPSIYQKCLYELNPQGIIVKGKLMFEGDYPKIMGESIQAIETLEKKTGKKS